MSTLLLGVIAPGLCCALLERVPRLRRRPLPLLRRYLTTDLVYLLTGFGGGTVLVLLYVEAVRAALGQMGLPRLGDRLTTRWLLLPAAVVAVDAGQYLAHWLMHRVDALWAFHRAHHSSLELDWVASFRSHLGEQLVRRGIGVLPAAVLGFPIDTIVTAGAVFGAVAIVNHANLRLDLGPLGRLLVTPGFHRVHHTPHTSEANLGTMLTIWDVLRGTARWSIPAADAPLGLPDDPSRQYPQDWLRQLVAPFAGRRGARFSAVSGS